jgi:hypothetical protein
MMIRRKDNMYVADGVVKKKGVIKKTNKTIKIAFLQKAEQKKQRVNC